MTVCHADAGGKTATPSLRVAIVDDHVMMLDGLRSWLQGGATDVEVVLTVDRWAELIASPEFPVDVVLLDLNLNDGVPLSVKIPAIRAAGSCVVVISSASDPLRIQDAISAGALGYVVKSKPAAEIVRAIRLAAQGQTYLSEDLATALAALEHLGGTKRFTPQEARVLELYASGLPLKSVARHLDISIHTAKDYLDHVREKYAQAGRSARTKVDLHRRAIEDGYLNGSA